MHTRDYLKSHAKQRLFERYGIRYTTQIRRSIIEQIETKKAVVVRELEGNRIIYEVKVKEGSGRFGKTTNCIVVWNPQLQEIATFLTRTRKDERRKTNMMERSETLSEKEVIEMSEGIRAKMVTGNRCSLCNSDDDYIGPRFQHSGTGKWMHVVPDYEIEVDGATTTADCENQMESVSTPEAEFSKFLASFNPVVTPEMEELNRSIQERVKNLCSQISETENAFLSQHLDKVETHNVCKYPQKQRIEKGRNISEEMIALLPKGASSYTEAEVKEFFPHIVIRVDYGEALAHHPQIGDSE